MPTQLTIDPAHTADVAGQGYNDCDPEAAITTSGWQWSSDNEAVATVAPINAAGTTARISGVAPGTTRIRAVVAPPAHPGRSFDAEVEVTVNELGSLTVTPSAASLIVGETEVLTAHAKDQNGSDVTVPINWASGNPGIVSVTPGAGPTATIQALASGTTQVTASVGNLSAQVPVAVAGETQPAFITGTMRGGDGVTPLPGITVNVSLSGTGIGSVVTDAAGEFTIDVTPGGTLNLLASGVCDPAHVCNHERSFNSTESEVVQVGPGETKMFDPQAQRGYHLRITSGFEDRTVAPGATFQLQLGYEVWVRANLPGGAPRIAVGFEGDYAAFHVVGLPGVYPPGPDGTGTTNLTVTAPSTSGQYDVYALLVTANATVTAQSVYEGAYPNGRLFIKVFTLTVQ